MELGPSSHPSIHSLCLHFNLNYGWLSELANKKRRMNKKDEMEVGGEPAGMEFFRVRGA